MWYMCLGFILLGIVVGSIGGIFLSPVLFKKRLVREAKEKVKPTEKQIRELLLALGRTPSEKQVRAIMNKISK